MKGSIEIKKIKFLDFQNNFNNQKFDDPIIKNMWQLINEFNISLKVVHDLFDGINSDIQRKYKIKHKKRFIALFLQGGWNCWFNDG